jgi:hypothetical protein
VFLSQHIVKPDQTRALKNVRALLLQMNAPAARWLPLLLLLTCTSCSQFDSKDDEDKLALQVIAVCIWTPQFLWFILCLWVRSKNKVLSTVLTVTPLVFSLTLLLGSGKFFMTLAWPMWASGLTLFIISQAQEEKINKK